ncbi:hypothetical protein P153DRAFT_354971 [Dothidotthia symphoricarpi CBS 119687]|uniref:SnoaL-like domain-containing protein n=1 Tax=Dothidotthia symphoricarpi CBS 119687 TaxID=1392245 RepID=A0A6A6AMJ4_9PLEO|nr:uncharacterized protein P153DRAFT_354971 [Dothidotthia symphoricarpi CBS 119687]KAF2132358.1 hypothetical protein P153DRAFT_354971 [Dothidotthia symphoricarpi CBS 119687]
MSNLVTLTALSPREAVADALYRCALGIDSNNRDMFESGCLKDESMSLVVGPSTIEGWTAINELFSKVFVLITTHIISNIRIELKDGADTASMTANALAYHVRPDDALKPEDTSYTSSCMYFIDLVKDGNDGLWKIKKWEIKIQWTTGDIAVLHG